MQDDMLTELLGSFQMLNDMKAHGADGNNSHSATTGAQLVLGTGAGGAAEDRSSESAGSQVAEAGYGSIVSSAADGAGAMGAGIDLGDAALFANFSAAFPGANFSELLREMLADGGGGGVGGEPSVLRSVVVNVDIYVVPLVALVGLLGNILSFAVFGCTFMRRLSSSVYLAALALADLGYLMCVLVSWTINTGLDLYAQDGWCQTFIYLTYVSSFLSVWYVVSFTTERYIAVHFPLRRQDLCTTRRAKLVVIALAFFALLFYTFATWTSGVSIIFLSPVCGPLPSFNRVVHILNNIDTVITLILPFLAILVMNVRIAYKVAKFYRERKHLQLRPWSSSHSRWSRRGRANGGCANSQLHAGGGGGGSGGGGANGCANSGANGGGVGTSTMHHYHLHTGSTGGAGGGSGGGAKKLHRSHQLYTRTQVRVTKMLLTVSTIFLVLNLPRHMVRTYLFIMNILHDDYQPTETYLLCHKFFQFVYYLQFSINLFLYNAFGKNFRKALHLLWKRVKHNVAESITRSYIARTRRSFFHAGEGDITLQEYRHISGDSGKYI